MGLVGFESAPRYRELIYKLISEDAEFVPGGFTLENDRPEWSFLKDEQLFQTQMTTSAAVALQAGFQQIMNPPNSQRIVTVLGLFGYKTGAGVVTYALTTTVRGAGQSISIPRDTRFNTPITPAAALVAREPVSVSTGSIVPPFGTDVALNQLQFGTTPARFDIPPIILAPGTGFVVADATVNEAINISIFGYSRIGRPEELVP